MKINSVNQQSFGKIIIKPGGEKYFNKFLTARDKSVLEAAKPSLEKLKKWDLEITSKGLRISSRIKADSVLMDEMLFPEEPISSEIKVKAIYDGFSEELGFGNFCKFYLQNKDHSTAVKNYNKYLSLPLVERSIELIKKFDEQEMRFLKLNEKSLFSRVLDALFGD